MTVRRTERGVAEGQGCTVQAGGAIELYFYGELSPAERNEVEGHLAGCAPCRAALQELAEIRVALAARPVMSAPPSGDWSVFMARLDAAIERNKATGAFEASARARHHLVAYLAMAALLTLVTISVIVAARSRGVSTSAQPASMSADIAPLQRQDDTNRPSLAAASEQHFERSKLVVLGLASKDPRHASSADWAYERELASSLLNDTRLYRMAAEDRGMTRTAGVMRDLELVLLQTSLSDEADVDTLAHIQRLIRKRDLLEKINTVTTTGL